MALPFTPRRGAREPGPRPDPAADDIGREQLEHARGVASMLAAGGLIVMVSLFLPPVDARAQAALLTLALLLGLASVVVARRRRWRSQSQLVVVSLNLIAITGVAVGVALAPATASGSTTLDRTQLLLVLSLLVAGAVMIRSLLAALNRRVELLAVLASTDQLTGVPNRRAWDGALAARINEPGPLCVALIDLDRFKLFNDLRGHQEGDAFLRRAAQRWLAEVGDHGLLARLGGEEFGLLLPGCEVPEASALVQRLRALVPDEQTCSAGLARREPGERPDDLLRRVDDALYGAKLAGRDRVRVASSTSDDLPHRQTEAWTTVIRRVLSERSLVSAYQPIIRLEDGVVVAYEALARPDRSRLDISVEQMFTVAQRRGVARELDWLCRCAALEGAAGLSPELPLFINCNVSTLLDPVHRVDEMLAACEAARRPPTSIVLEITERELVGDLARLRDVVRDHRRVGFRFAIDDVGEGHSTLEVLATTAPEFIKIARSLTVDAMNRGPRAAIRAVVAFAAEAGALVIAEGIEDVGAALQVGRLGVHLGQGFFFGRPGLPARPTAVRLATATSAGAPPAPLVAAG